MTWSAYSERLVELYRGKARVGRPPYDPVLIFKMLLISYKEPWLQLQASTSYKQGTKARYRVEQVFGWAKAWCGFERCRYLGLARYRLQALFTFLVCNLKRLVKRLVGITFRAQAKGRRAETFRPVYSVVPWA